MDHDSTRLARATLRLGRRLEAFALTLLVLALLGYGWLGWRIWQDSAHWAERDAQTQALLELVRRSQP
jgi:hypothetical protein